ncbi:hypothetical protein TNIN_484611, partial [Trichonephila inaurata madagascariensis]
MSPSRSLIHENNWLLRNWTSVLDSRARFEHRDINLLLERSMRRLESQRFFAYPFKSNKADTICDVDQLEESIGVFMHHLRSSALKSFRKRRILPARTFI